jgi:PAS domain S-box-containing protein
MMSDHPQSPRALADEHTFREIVEGTASETGQAFFGALVRSVARSLDVHGAWVTEYLPDQRRLRAIAFWLGDDWVDEYEYDIAGTPCESVVEDAELVHVPDRLVELFPDDPDLQPFGAVSYLGVPLEDADGTVLGHLAALDRRPLEDDAKVLAIFRIFANRAAAELRRLSAESRVRDREQKLTRLIDSAMDAILELDASLQINRTNPAARKVFRAEDEALVGSPLLDLVSPQSGQRLQTLLGELQSLPEGRRYLWVPGGLQACRADGEEFPAEATFSSFETGGKVFYTLILRDTNDRRQAEQRIESLKSEADYLRREVQELQNFGAIIGQSRALQRTIRAVRDVAATDTTVLLLGETGTGKELFARAIHAESKRPDHLLITVNCAAIPASLIESEFFGHEKGAFTGATRHREGRFALADGGTIFLDEVGELPLDLQAKLLRVLQEGEFEPVGSSGTRKVDVRVIAATNRDLERAVEGGSFREDLFYRINVFPIRVPPLRERDDDVVLLAAAFVEQFGRRLGRPVVQLSADQARRLRRYDWPGNVRELQNVIERAVITAREGVLDLDRVLPLEPSEVHPEPEAPDASPQRVLTSAQLRELEQRNLLLALERAEWKVSGPGGAAEFLDLAPSTVSSRMRALGLRRPSPA